jgi:hypothetical protein
MARFAFSAAACYCLLVLSIPAQGQVADPDRLIKKSDVVAVAQVISVEQTGSGSIEFPQRHPISADFRLAKLHVTEVLKGTSGSNSIAVPYTILSTRGAAHTGGVPPGYTYRDTLIPNSTRLVFLKHAASRYEFTNGTWLSIVCAPDAPNGPEPVDPLDRVLSRIAAALFSTSVPRSEKAEAIWELRSVRMDSVIPALRTFLHGDVAAKDESLRVEALGALLAHEDLLVVDEVEAELLKEPKSYSPCNLLLTFTATVPASRSAPVIDHIAGSNANMRDCVASAVRISAERSRKAWEGLVAKIGHVLSQQGITCSGQRLHIAIKDAAQIAGNSVALVDFCPGGAYTDWIVSMRLEADQPVLARFRIDNGKSAEIGFADGASVMHGMDAKLVPERNATYGIEWDNDETMHLKRCAVRAYVWNSGEKTFDLNPTVSTRARVSYCHTLQQVLLKTTLRRGH